MLALRALESLELLDDLLMIILLDSEMANATYSIMVLVLGIFLKFKFFFLQMSGC